ncbi:desumoylating isopeptidase 1 [Canna indica]|uniref:Desumoylating isopeptidase 1 n=1 Tax=Canna indica TaxID=4628 RepID=A0AAQ3KGT0_9LILI|nr:desumoylating isopeptidase 1 [Canna indica]
MIQRLETTMKSGAVPQAPQFNPITTNRPISSCDVATKTEAIKNADSENSSIKVCNNGNGIPPAVEPVASSGEKKSAVAGDLLGDARNRVQEEITKEFAAIMATGTLRAGEAAALATRRVMERHGRLNAPMQRG